MAILDEAIDRLNERVCQLEAQNLALKVIIQGLLPATEPHSFDVRTYLTKARAAFDTLDVHDGQTKAFLSSGQSVFDYVLSDQSKKG